MVAFKYYKYLEEFKKQANEHNKPIIILQLKKRNIQNENFTEGLNSR
jgi:hypothetical protein